MVIIELKVLFVNGFNALKMFLVLLHFTKSSNGQRVFPDHPTFYSTYKLMDNKDHYVYTDKFSIDVVDLTKINLATKEDRLYNIDKWAQLFKATTWEDIKMLAAQDVYISKAGETYYEITADEHERQLAEAREDVLRRERATKRREEKLLKELAEVTQNLESASKELDVTRLAMTEKDQRIAELEAQLAEKKK